MVMKLKNRADTARGFGTSVGRLMSLDSCNEQGLDPGINRLPARY
jgi:hypothetical protein